MDIPDEPPIAFTVTSEKGIPISHGHAVPINLVARAPHMLLMLLEITSGLIVQQRMEFGCVSHVIW